MKKIDNALDILKQLGVPKQQHNERSALTLLALQEQTPWSDAQQSALRIHDILLFMKTHYAKEYAENTRETIRRQTIHQFEQAGIVARNPDNPERPKNSPHTVYAISVEALRMIQSYETPEWESCLQAFVKKQGKLAEKYQKRRQQHRLSVATPQVTLTFSPGKHNELQARIIDTLQPHFIPEAILVYVGDAAQKMLYVNEDWLQRLQIPLTQHDKLPDVVLYDAHRHCLFLIEAVTSHGPVSPKRQVELQCALQACPARKIYISAFLSLSEFKRHIDNIAWETEVWVADNADHMIHFNGPKFLQAYPGKEA